MFAPKYHPYMVTNEQLHRECLRHFWFSQIVFAPFWFLAIILF